MALWHIWNAHSMHCTSFGTYTATLKETSPRKLHPITYLRYFCYRTGLELVYNTSIQKLGKLVLRHCSPTVLLRDPLVLLD